MNFHGWIALPLEVMAKENGINISADSIECGQFVEVMLQILKFKKVSSKDFENKCLPYQGKTVFEISEIKAFELYDDFKLLIKS
ncbi:MAG: hypothetical protein K2J47_05385 [Ruminococcus sp.]|nr:hypothetical protein [Ruminococcus sp.]MDE6788738.1 hypothetical protein [Ruminococcus sp.]